MARFFVCIIRGYVTMVLNGEVIVNAVFSNEKQKVEEFV